MNEGLKKKTIKLLQEGRASMLKEMEMANSLDDFNKVIELEELVDAVDTTVGELRAVKQELLELSTTPPEFNELEYLHSKLKL